jgi:hypothetical protein
VWLDSAVADEFGDSGGAVVRHGNSCSEKDSLFGDVWHINTEIEIDLISIESFFSIFEIRLQSSYEPAKRTREGYASI